MKRLVILEFVKMCVESIALAALVGVIIGVIGYLKEWNSLIAYSNGFFLAGCLLILAGTSTRVAAGQEIGRFRLLDAESFRGMSSGDRVDFIITASSSYRLVILGLLSGLLCILISAVTAYLL